MGVRRPTRLPGVPVAVLAFGIHALSVATLFAEPYENDFTKGLGRWRLENAEGACHAVEGLKFARFSEYGGAILERRATDWSAHTSLLVELKNSGQRAQELSLKFKGGGRQYTREFRIGAGQHLIHRENLADLQTKVDVSRITYMKLFGRRGRVQLALKEIRFEGGTRAGDGLELYGNFETMGVIASVPAGHTPRQIGEVRCSLWSDGEWRRVHDLVQVGSQKWFATSLFFLKPATAYKARVEFYNRQGRQIASLEGEGRTRAEPELPEPGRLLYVSTDGSDANKGTEDSPFGTLKAAFSRATPGTTVLVRGGTYYEGGLTFRTDGTPDAPIVVRAAPDERVILEGAAPKLIPAKGWKDEGGGVFSHPYGGRCLNASVQHRETGKWTRLFVLGDLQSLKNRTWQGTSFRQRHIEGALFCDGRTAYVVPPGPPEEYRICVSAQTRGIVLESRSHIAFDGLEMRNYGKGNYGCAAFLRDSSNTLFQNCRVRHCNTGIWLKGACSNNTVQDCEFLDDTDKWSWKMVKSNAHNHVESGGVYIEGTYSGRGMVIRRNRFSGLFDGVHLAPFVKIGGRTSETDFYGNTVTDISDDLIETDGYSRNVRIFDNLMDISLSGVSLAQALDGPTFILYNQILNSGVCQATREESFEGYPFKTNGGTGSKIGSGEVFFYHNTSCTSDPKSRAILIKSGRWKKLTFRNNIWVGRAEGFVSWRAPLSPLDFDYDDLYVENGGTLMRLGKDVYHTLGDVQRGTSHLKHGFSVDPRLRKTATGAFELAPDSPLIDRGVAIPGINDERTKGEGPDLGACEVR